MVTQSQRNTGVLRTGLAFEAARMLRLFGPRSLKMALFASILGLVDDLQVRYVDVARFGNGFEVMYQAAFIVVAGTIAFFVLRDRSWSTARNASNLLMTIPVATIGDNVSIDFGTLRPYVMLIPRQGYVWREHVFAGNVTLSHVAGWVNQQTLMSGLLNGYVAAVCIAAGYVVLQVAWSCRSRG